VNNLQAKILEVIKPISSIFRKKPLSYGPASIDQDEWIALHYQRTSIFRFGSLVPFFYDLISIKKFLL